MHISGRLDATGRDHRHGRVLAKMPVCTRDGPIMLPTQGDPCSAPTLALRSCRNVDPLRGGSVDLGLRLPPGNMFPPRSNHARPCPHSNQGTQNGYGTRASLGTGPDARLGARSARLSRQKAPLRRKGDAPRVCDVRRKALYCGRWCTPLERPGETFAGGDRLMRTRASEPIRHGRPAPVRQRLQPIVSPRPDLQCASGLPCLPRPHASSRGLGA